jgi:hypothetical protein
MCLSIFYPPLSLRQVPHITLIFLAHRQRDLLPELGFLAWFSGQAVDGHLTRDGRSDDLSWDTWNWDPEMLVGLCCGLK